MANKYDKILDAYREKDTSTNVVSSFNGRTGAVVSQVGDYTTTLVAEGTNLYFTTARVLSAMSGLYEVPLTFSTGLTRTTNTITANLSTGVAGGQSAIGGINTTDKLTLKATTGAGSGGTSGEAIIFQVGNNGSVEAGRILRSGSTGLWGFNSTTPTNTIQIGSGDLFIHSGGELRGGTSDSVYGFIRPYDSSDGNMYLQARGNNNIILQTTGTGYVGIGTTSPVGTLDISTNIFQTLATFTSTVLDIFNSGSNTAFTHAISEHAAYGGVTGGMLLIGKSNNSVVPSMSLYGINDVAPTSNPIFLFAGGKGNSAKVQALAATDQLFGLENTAVGGIGTGTRVMTAFGDGHFTFPSAPTATANYGLVSLGAGGFGGGASNYASSANGTYIAANHSGAFTGKWFDFQVSGTSLFSASGSGNTASIMTVFNSNNSVGAFTLYGINSETRAVVGTQQNGTDYITVNPLSYAAILGSPAGYSVQLFCASTAGLTLLASGLKVGIGTIAPSYKLDVVTSGTAAGRFTTTGATLSSPIADFLDTTNGVELVATANSTTGAFGTFSNHNFSLITNDIVRATVTSTSLQLVVSSLARSIDSGNIGISGGTDNSSGQALINLYGKTHATLAGEVDIFGDTITFNAATTPFTERARINSTGMGIGITPTSLLHTNGSFATGYVAKTSTYTATISDFTIDCTTGTFTVNLPTAVGITGRIYVIKNTGTGVITIDANSTETIDGALTQTLSVQYTSYMIQSNGANWLII